MHVFAFIHTLLGLFEDVLQRHHKRRPFLSLDELLTRGKVDVDIQVEELQGVEADVDDADRQLFIPDGGLFLEDERTDDVLQEEDDRVRVVLHVLDEFDLFVDGPLQLPTLAEDAYFLLLRCIMMYKYFSPFRRNYSSNPLSSLRQFSRAILSFLQGCPKKMIWMVSMTICSASASIT